MGIVEVLLVVIGNVMHHAFVDQIIHGLGGLEGQVFYVGFANQGSIY